MQGNPISIISKTDQHQTEDITFPQVKREFVSSVQTGVEFCAIEKPSCVMDSHFITYHRRLRPTAFSLDNLRKTAIRIKIMEIKSAHWTRIANTQMRVLSFSVDTGFAGFLQPPGNGLAVLSADQQCCKCRTSRWLCCDTGIKQATVGTSLQISASILSRVTYLASTRF